MCGLERKAGDGMRLETRAFRSAAVVWSGRASGVKSGELCARIRALVPCTGGGSREGQRVE